MKPTVEQVAVVLHTSDHRGDHDAGIAVWYDIQPDETVLEMVERLMTEQRIQSDRAYERRYHHRMRPENGDYITIRVRVKR